MAIDLSGEIVGRLTVIERVNNEPGSHARWRCECSCGGEVVVTSNHLRRAIPVRSCGCLRTERDEMKGQRFGRLLVIALNGRLGAAGAPACLCLCDCGVRVRVVAGNLRSGNSTSCGCAHREMMTRRFTTHGISGTPEYNSIMHAKRRARALKAGGTFTADDVRRIYDSQSGECVYCDEWLPLSMMQRDHIVALARGGSNWPSNIQLLCRSCNQRKWALHPDEFARRMGKL